MGHRQDLRLGLQKAIAMAGSISALAELIGIRRQAVAQWDKIPLFRVVEVEKATGIPREQLRPDIFRGYSDG